MLKVSSNLKYYLILPKVFEKYARVYIMYKDTFVLR